MAGPPIDLLPTDSDGTDTRSDGEAKICQKQLFDSDHEFDVETFSNEVIVVFVLGGPGSGKGTQCPKIVDQFGFKHLCAGDLLQAEIDSGSEHGAMIHNFKKEGKIVPSTLTVKLLQQAMIQSETKKFIIDGFPRNEENRIAFEKIGTVDDTINVIPKRLKVYFESTMPLINHYSSKGKVCKIDAQRSVDEVFEDVKSIFSKLKPGI